jgi:hypothetical protein
MTKIENFVFYSLMLLNMKGFAKKTHCIVHLGIFGQLALVLNDTASRRTSCSHVKVLHVNSLFFSMLYHLKVKGITLMLYHYNEYL